MRPLARFLVPLLAVSASLPAGGQMSEQEMPPQSAAIVKVAALPLAREPFLAELTHQVATQLKLEGELQLELTRPWAGPRLAPDTPWQLEVFDLPAIPSANMMLRCRLTAAGATLGEWSLYVRAQLWRDAWITRVPVDRGQTFDPALVNTRRIDAFRERDTMPVAAADGTLAFSRPITAGRLLTWRDLAKKSLVRKGDIVEVAAIDGRLSITMKAQALANGARGDTVVVRNLESKRDFPALVVSENRVEVRF
ncbi:MAG: flagellar basal body P-ring formation protein FlgA [Opitutae bacterium]|nr:flagellar basal body P-ring formation protein FlgA [Opitutae bacterium]